MSDYLANEADEFMFRESLVSLRGSHVDGMGEVVQALTPLAGFEGLDGFEEDELKVWLRWCEHRRFSENVMHVGHWLVIRKESAHVGVLRLTNHATSRVDISYRLPHTGVNLAEDAAAAIRLLE